MTAAREPFLPLPAPRHRLGPVTEFRSTWLASSIRVLRDRGHFDAYAAALPPERRDEIVHAVAGTWLPVDLALLHYEACERMNLSETQIVGIGRAVEEIAHRTSMQLMLRIARESGVTPWNAFAQQQRMWERVWRGGGVTVDKLGPKEAQLEVVGWPCARFPYCRVALRGLLLAQTGMLARSAYVHAIPSRCTATSLCYRISWA